MKKIIPFCLFFQAALKVLAISWLAKVRKMQVEQGCLEWDSMNKVMGKLVSKLIVVPIVFH